MSKSWLRRRDVADVKDFASAKRANVPRLQRLYRQDLPGAGDEFDFIRFAIVVDMNDRADIARTKVLLREIARQNDYIMLAQDHDFSAVCFLGAE